MVKIFWGLIITLTIMSCSKVQKQGNYNWRGENRDGYSIEKGLADIWPENGPELLWSTDSILGKGYTSAAVTENGIFIAGTKDTTGVMYCFNFDGSVKWEKEYGPEWSKGFPGTRSNLTINGDDIYFLAGWGNAFKMDKNTGEIIWMVNLIKEFKGKNPFFGYSDAPLVKDSVVIFVPGGDSISMVALNTSNGRTIWTSPGIGEPMGYCPPRYIEHNGKKIILTMMQKHLIAVNFETGDTLVTNFNYGKWTDNTNTPYFFEGKIFITSPYKGGAKLLQLNEDATSYSVVWENKDFDMGIGSYILQDNIIFGSAQAKREWIAIDLSNGETLFETRKPGIGSVINADGKVFCFSDNGKMSLIKLSSDLINVISSFTLFYRK